MNPEFMLASIALIVPLVFFSFVIGILWITRAVWWRKLKRRFLERSEP